MNTRLTLIATRLGEGNKSLQNSDSVYQNKQNLIILLNMQSRSGEASVTPHLVISVIIRMYEQISKET